jgi:hypothetical protein
VVDCVIIRRYAAEAVDKQNIELLDLSREILTLTKEVRSLADPTGGGSSSRRA